MHPKLKWVEKLAQSLSFSMPGITFSVNDHVDPLMKVVVLNFNEAMSKKDHSMVVKIARGFAEVNDCIVYRTRKGLKTLELDVLTKTRLGEVMNNSPFVGDKADVKED